MSNSKLSRCFFSFFLSLGSLNCVQDLAYSHGTLAPVKQLVPLKYYHPVSTSDCFSEEDLETLNRGLKGSFRAAKQDYLDGQVEVKLEDRNGEKEPVFVLTDGGRVVNKIYSSSITSVRGADLVSLDGEQTQPALGIWYKQDGDANDFYLLNVEQDIGEITNIAYRMKENPQLGRNCEPEESNPEPPGKTGPAPYEPLRLSPREVVDICSYGEASLAAKDKRVQEMDKFYFKDCEYLSSDDSVSRVESLVEAIPQGKLESAVILTCGNASIPSARKCPKEVYNNDRLSFLRGFSSGGDLVGKIDSSFKYLSWMAYPNGTLLNERSVSLYLVTGSDETAKIGPLLP